MTSGDEANRRDGQRELFLPLVLPAEIDEYIEGIERERPGESGLHHIVTQDYYRLVDWLNYKYRMRVAFTSILFLTDYLALVACAAAAVGYTYRPLEVIVENIGHATTAVAH
jgi:hypothetical protein